MVDRPMPDEILERYQNLSHRELYDMLLAGTPSQVDELVTSWSSMRDTAQALADALRADLERLNGSWDSAAGREYQYRVGLIATYAETLSREFDSIQSGLSSMSSALAAAQREAESPEETDDMDQTVSGAARGAAYGSVPRPDRHHRRRHHRRGDGHNQDEAEREAARQRMVALVAGLAAQYAVTDASTWPATVPPPPTDLPIGDPSTTVVPTATPTTTEVSQAPTIGVSTRDGTTTGPTVTVHSGPSVNPDAASPTLDEATAEPAATGLLGAGGDTLTGATSATGGLTLGAGAGAAGAPGLGGAGAAAGLGAGAAAAAGLGRGSGLTGASSSGHLLGQPGDGRAGGQGAGPRSATASTTLNAGAGRRAAPGTAVPGGDDEPNEHLTWLTEDEMVRGGDEATPPPVLGQSPAADAAPDQPAPSDEPARPSAS